MAGVMSLVRKSEIESAIRGRTCKFTKKPIAPGEKCLVVYPAAQRRNCYSREVGLRMVEKARRILDKIEADLRR